MIKKKQAFVGIAKLSSFRYHPSDEAKRSRGNNKIALWNLEMNGQLFRSLSMILYFHVFASSKVQNEKTVLAIELSRT